MSALNFHKEFAAAVEAGEKRQTIRPLRKDGRRPCKLDGRLQLYTGMRTRACRKLADAVCTMIVPITIIDAKRADIGGAPAEPLHLHEVARRDGFDSWGALVGWVEKNFGHLREEPDDPVLPFTGYLIQWRLEGPA